MFFMSVKSYEILKLILAPSAEILLSSKSPIKLLGWFSCVEMCFALCCVTCEWPHFLCHKNWIIKPYCPLLCVMSESQLADIFREGGMIVLVARLLWWGEGNGCNLLFLITKHVFENLGGGGNCPVAAPGWGLVSSCSHFAPYSSLFISWCFLFISAICRNRTISQDHKQDGENRLYGSVVYLM